jgi:HK97 gp10 family phage protein
MKTSLKLEGAAELAAGLEELKGVTAVNVVRKSLTESLEPVAASAKGRVPVDRGDLQQSIGIGTRLTRRQKGLRQPIVSHNGVEAYVGPGLVGNRYQGAHGHLVEFGTYRTAPRPFMRPAWLSNLTIVFNGLAQSMGENLSRAAKAAAKKALKAKR